MIIIYVNENREITTTSHLSLDITAAITVAVVVYCIIYKKEENNDSRKIKR